MRLSDEEADDLYTRLGATSAVEPQARGIPGLDELAEVLEVPPGKGNGVMVMGMSGNTYSLVALITAHLLLMADDVARRQSKQQSSE